MVVNCVSDIGGEIIVLVLMSPYNFTDFVLLEDTLFKVSQVYHHFCYIILYTFIEISNFSNQISFCS